FIFTMQNWYPFLKQYNNEDEIKNKIKASIELSIKAELNKITPTQVNLSNKQFLEDCLEYNSPIKCIKMAAQTGWYWFDDHERTDLLTRLIQKNITIQVIGNSASAIENIAVTMRDPDPQKQLRYTGFNNTLAKWHEYEKIYPNLELRVSDYPVLRKTLIVEFEDNFSRVLIRDYAYGSPADEFSPHTQMSCNDLNYNYYYVEFEFLWNEAKTYEQWCELEKTIQR
ncbi:MAG: hypothetical protein MJ157_01955, partial [Clostridia bacterium]|nr:hypothetical protein [Clostridia bacterium]